MTMVWQASTQLLAKPVLFCPDSMPPFGRITSAIFSENLEQTAFILHPIKTSSIYEHFKFPKA
jgi:hypothetical protein